MIWIWGLVIWKEAARSSLHYDLYCVIVNFYTVFIAQNKSYLTNIITFDIIAIMYLFDKSFFVFTISEVNFYIVYTNAIDGRIEIYPVQNVSIRCFYSIRIMVLPLNA